MSTSLNEGPSDERDNLLCLLLSNYPLMTGVRELHRLDNDRYLSANAEGRSEMMQSKFEELTGSLQRLYQRLQQCQEDPAVELPPIDKDTDGIITRIGLHEIATALRVTHDTLGGEHTMEFCRETALEAMRFCNSKGLEPTEGIIQDRVTSQRFPLTRLLPRNLVNPNVRGDVEAVLSMIPTELVDECLGNFQRDYTEGIALGKTEPDASTWAAEKMKSTYYSSYYESRGDTSESKCTAVEQAAKSIWPSLMSAEVAELPSISAASGSSSTAPSAFRSHNDNDSDSDPRIQIVGRLPTLNSAVSFLHALEHRGYRPNGQAGAAVQSTAFEASRREFSQFIEEKALTASDLQNATWICTSHDELNNTNPRHIPSECTPLTEESGEDNSLEYHSSYSYLSH
ncbi:hypothetical protein BCR39DRAFT_581706 [Naematelia encephala]|uniref:Uncharacterized protein n=1 Tax=Naematelia encephala TaxID=71784 RepID=A0A1Y2APW1_9TREE|nr:hypothetical protein BCR39DRAFT_581706 [Naematelia encephala]